MKEGYKQAICLIVKCDNFIVAWSKIDMLTKVCYFSYKATVIFPYHSRMMKIGLKR